MDNEPISIPLGLVFNKEHKRESMKKRVEKNDKYYLIRPWYLSNICHVKFKLKCNFWLKTADFFGTIAILKRNVYIVN